jgi:hypothetical protein
MRRITVRAHFSETGIAKLLQEYGLLVLATDAQAKGKGLNNGVLGQ